MTPTPYALRRRALATLLALIATMGTAQAQDVLKIGTRAGPNEEITEAAARAAQRLGLKLQPVVFDGVVNPNEALVGRDLQANAFQHIVYLNAEIKNRGYKIVKAADIYTVPLAIYSKKYKTLDELPVGARFAIPADDANQSRALLALQDHGLIKLRADFNQDQQNASLLDVAENPRKLKFVELATQVLAASLPDVDAGATNANFASQLAKLSLTEALARESAQRTQRYTQIVAVRIEDKDRPWVKTLVASFQSEEVRQLIESRYKHVLAPAF